MKKFIYAFIYAFRGLWHFLSTERHALIHSMAAIVALSMSWYYSISRYEWIAIILAIGIVFIAEMSNTAIEKLSDTLHPRKSTGIKTTKDIAAGMVLCSAVTAASIGAIVFLPYICESW